MTQRDREEGLTLSEQFNLAVAFVQVWAVSIEVCLHERLGRRYPGPRGVFVIPLVLVYCLGWQGHNLAPMMCFLFVYLLFCGAHRLDAASAERRTQGHSRYTGRPLLMNLFPTATEWSVKSWIEPLCVVVGGLILTVATPPLGWYVTLGGICMRLSTSLSGMIEEHRAMDMNDATIEQEMVIDRFREMRNED